jgi:hypothetical protein
LVALCAAYSSWNGDRLQAKWNYPPHIKDKVQMILLSLSEYTVAENLKKE